MIFLPNGDDFVTENSSEAMLDEPAFVLMKQVWKVFTELSPFSKWLLFLLP